MKILLSCAAVAVLAVIPTNVGAQEAGPIPINCAWSTTWSELKAAMPPAPTGAKITPPKKKRGSIDRPDSNVRRTITGAWTVELVIDDKGDVRDARIIQAPMIGPCSPQMARRRLLCAGIAVRANHAFGWPCWTSPCR